ncbi:MAG: hypothetical protein Q9217_004158 [Psora testacea]
MSLFGSSPDESDLITSNARSEQKSSLFDDDALNTSRGLFDDGANGDSPWSMPTSKKASRGNPVKTLLPATDVPESYIEAYDVLGLSEFKVDGGKVSIVGLRKILEGTRMEKAEQDTIIRLVTGGQDMATLGRNEVNVFLALVGLAQEGEEVSLDTVDERRKNLPEPSLPYINKLRTAKVSENVERTPPQQPQRFGPQDRQTTPSTSPGKSRRIRKDSLENLDADPWASPAITKAQTSAVHNEATPSPNAITAVKPTRSGLTEPCRTTSAFTTHPEAPATADDQMQSSNGAASTRPEASANWGSYGTSNENFTGAQHGGLGGAFGSGGDDQGNRSNGGAGRSLGGGRITNRGAEEFVTVTLLPEKEGMFMFQHHNYEVKSARRGTSVIRRYSDFVWLLDCLHKRYPFRQLPLLPPKRVAVNGRHLSADVTFMEKRRRGLRRFVNALVRHPVLNQEQLVVMFLTVPTHQELAVWRKQATISVQEEFTGKTLPPELEDSLPKNLSETFDTVRSGVRQSADHYIGLCNLLERLTKRNQGVAADYSRFSQALSNLTEASQSTYATDTDDVPLLNEGINSTAKHMTISQNLLEDEARAWDEGVLEDFKKQRDSLVSIRDMFDRRDRYAKDNIPQLERRIEANENKLASMMAGAGGKPGEREKLELAVRADKQSIVDQHARGVFIKECIRDELVYFQQSQYHVSRTHQDWSQERVKYAELQADNWRRLSEEVEHMPLGD